MAAPYDTSTSDTTSDTTNGSTKATKGQPYTEEELWAMWRLLYHRLMDDLTSAANSKERIDISTLNLARAFLKDNGVTLDMTHVADVMKSMKSMEGIKLPFEEDHRDYESQPSDAPSVAGDQPGKTTEALSSSCPATDGLEGIKLPFEDDPCGYAA